MKISISQSRNKKIIEHTPALDVRADEKLRAEYS